MSERILRGLLGAQWAAGNFVCVGLDSDPLKIPDVIHTENTADKIVAFNMAIVGATADLVCAYKPNAAFYEAYGSEGFEALQRTIMGVNDIAPDVPVILDAKRADIGNTNVGYEKAAFDILGADAITVNPYFGYEALQPFLERKNKGIFILCRTSNPGAGEFQNLLVNGEPLYRIVARHVSEKWNKNGNCILVVGATCPEELAKVRDVVGDMPILIPGIGAQGGDVEKAVKAGKDSQGKGIIINSSRKIIFASNGPDFAEAARQETLKLDNMISQYLLEA